MRVVKLPDEIVQVLIEAKCPDLLPEWLRFVKGVVDSEDLPLSLSREKPQDTALIGKIGGVLTKKIIRFLQEMMRKEPEKYKEKFFKEFGAFLKEVRGQTRVSRHFRRRRDQFVAYKLGCSDGHVVGLRIEISSI